MNESKRRLDALVISIIRAEDAAAVSTGIVQQRLERQYGVKMEYRALLDLLNKLVEEGILEYHLGEYGEYTLPG